MSDSTLHKNPNPAKPNPSAVKPNTAPSQSNAAAKPETQFTTENIGKWASKQENPFAAQNRKDQAKKQKQNEARKKATPVVAIVAGAIAAGIAIFGLVMLVINLTKVTPLSEITAEESTIMQDEAQKIFDKHTQNINTEDKEGLTDKDKEAIQKAIAAVNKYYEQQANRAENNTVSAQLIMNQMWLYLWNNQPEAALEVSKKLSTDGLNYDQLSNFYGLMQSVYYALGDMEQSNHYYDLMIEIIGEDNYVAG